MARVTDGGGRPVSGQAPSVVVGVVVDNVDPEELGRILVKFPTLPGEPQSFWLRQITPSGGAVGGFYALPEVGDEVLVAFMQGDHDYGVILGQFWNGKLKPPKEAKDGMPGAGKTDTGGSWSKDKFSDGSRDTKKNDRRLWRSRAGHLILLDDTKGKESVQIWDGKHQMSIVFDMKDARLLITNNKGDVHFRSKGSMYLEAGGNVHLRAGNELIGESVKDTKYKAGKDCTIEAVKNMSLKANLNFTAEGRVNATVKAGVRLTIQGTMVSATGAAMASITGGAAVSVRGGMVAIN